MILVYQRSRDVEAMQVILMINIVFLVEGRPRTNFIAFINSCAFMSDNNSNEYSDNLTKKSVRLTIKTYSQLQGMVYQYLVYNIELYPGFLKVNENISPSSIFTVSSLESCTCCFTSYKNLPKHLHRMQC